LSSNSSAKKLSAALDRYKKITSLAQDSTFWILKIIDARKFPLTELQGVLDIFKSVLVSYFDSKKSHLKPEFIGLVFKRRPWIGHNLFGFLLEKCGSAKAQFRQVEALDLIQVILKSLIKMKDDEMLKNHIPRLRNLVAQLAMNMPEKPARRADVRKFCNKVFHILTSCKMGSIFLENLKPDARAVLESQFRDTFLALTKIEENKEA
jgi:DNA polymerase phi